MITEKKKGHRYILPALMVTLVLGLLLLNKPADARYPAATAPSLPGLAGLPPALPALPDQQINDGFHNLPLGLQGASMSTLVRMGLVHPQAVAPVPSAGGPVSPLSPHSVINWGPERNTSNVSGSNEPGAYMHPSDPLYAIVSGNTSGCTGVARINNTSNGGSTWQTRCSPQQSNSGDGVSAWLPASPGQNWAINTALGGSPVSIAASRSTDRGATWAAYASNINTNGFFNDRQYMWSDQDPASPFYGRNYMSETLFDTGGTGSTNTTASKFSSDNGSTWSAAFMHENPGAFNTEGNRQFGSVAFQPGGAIVFGWMAVKCCGGAPSVNVPNKYRWARSTDGGVTFPISGTAATDPLANSVSFNSTSPGGFRWSPQATIGGDPVDGSLVFVWLRERVANNQTGTAVYFSRSTNNGASWTAPATVFNDPNPNNTQYFPWVQISSDHVIHVTYSSSVGGVGTTLGHYYTQSTDGGGSWSAPFQLNGVNFTAAGFMGDYAAVHIGGINGSNASIIASWTDNRAGTQHYARIGTFAVGTPTPTHTPCTPACTNTPTNSPTNTFTPTRTNTPTSTPSPTATASTCGPTSNYTVSQSSGVPLVAGTSDIGNHGDDIATTINLPFSYTLYGTSYITASINSNGTMQFTGSTTAFTNACLPSVTVNNSILGQWDDLRTDQTGNCTLYGGVGCGIFTSTSGTAPNRIFNIEWRTVYFNATAQRANFVIRLYEGQSRFDIIYGIMEQGGSGATVGVQRGTGSQFTQFSCNTSSVTNTLQLVFTQPPCASPTVTNTPTPVPPTFTFTRTPTATNTHTSTNTPTRTNTSTNTSTNTPTNTPTNTLTNTNTPTFTFTRTSTPTNTNTPTNTPTFTLTPTNTPIFTNTPTDTPTDTNTPTFTNTPTDTPTNTHTHTPTNTNIPTFTNTTTSTPTNTSTNTDTPTNTPVVTDTPTNTPTVTNTPVKLLVGHVVEQGCASNANPITLTLKLGATEVNYGPQSPDASGFFTVNVSSLAGGAYSWRAKGVRYLANAGAVAIPAGASTTQLEIGLMRGGDINDDNIVNISDFNSLNASFGLQSGDPGYNPNADFTCDGVVSIQDYNVFRSNFGTSGAPPIRPGAR